MRSLPLFKFNTRARSTSLGIALCTMFIVASFSVVGGLRSSMDALTDNFSSEYVVVTRPGATGPEFFQGADLASVAERTAFGLFSEVHVSSPSQDVIAFGVSDPNSVLPESISTSGTSVLAGLSLSFPDTVTLEGATTVNATVAGHFSSSIFPSYWLLGSMDLLGQLTDKEGAFNFAIARQLSSAEIDSLAASGFSVQELIGIIQFLDSGVREIESDATWVLIPSAFVVAVLAYSFIGSETADKRHEIGILKTIGAGRRRVLAYLMFNALIICAWGGLLGLALGIVLSYGVSTMTSAMFTSVFIVEVNEGLLLIAYVATVGAGLAGALAPAVRMSFSSPVKDLKEVAPFS